MAERRMFAKTIIDSDAFLELPAAAQLLYFHLAMRADDDGFVNKPKSIARMMGCTDKTLTQLANGGFLILFDSGVTVIRHWQMHNKVRKDTYKKTVCRAERDQLELDECGVYCIGGTGSVQVRDESVTDPLRKDRLGKDRSGKVRSGEESKDAPRRFTPPSADQVQRYCQERNNCVDPVRFVDYYESNGWMVGRNKMKDWKAAVRSWERKEKTGAAISNPFLEMAVVQ